MKFRLTTWPILFVAFLSFQFTVSAQDFEQRRQQYFDSAAVNPNDNAMVIEAYLGQPVTQQYLDNIYNVMLTRSTIDFAIVQLIRVMFLGNGAYDNQVVPQLSLFPYWINYGDTLRGYWSENHMIMWMSSDWLIHERTGRPIDANLDQRLRHYLQLKIDYGFYEFLSSVYAPYCLSGLLNLADFAEDEEIKTLATQASKRLLREMLLLTNDQGVFFPASGRNYPGKFINAHGQNHSSLIYLLTGLGPAPSEATHAGGFLATSSIDFSDVTATWSANEDTILAIGHSLQEGLVINAALADLDRTIFQWSSGGYFHPDLVSETVTLLEDSNMWEHVDFALLAGLQGFSLDQYAVLAENLSVISKSSVISGQDVAIFKNGGVTLSSIQDFWKGKVGFQQHPVVACVGQTAVYTGSGPVFADWEERTADNANEHLPYVEQAHNVALIMYRPEVIPEVLPFDNKDVALFWQDTAYDETLENGNWLIGRQDENYVAVRRSCVGDINGVWGCETSNVGLFGGGQTWVIVVGNADMYGNFETFQGIVGQAVFEEEWLITTGTGGGNYYASITFDTIQVDYTWEGEGGTSVTDFLEAEGILGIYPNPTNGIFTLEIPETSVMPRLSVFNAMGQLVQRMEGIAVGKVQMNAQDWPAGLYHIMLDSEAGRSYSKIVKQ